MKKSLRLATVVFGSLAVPACAADDVVDPTPVTPPPVTESVALPATAVDVPAFHRSNCIAAPSGAVAYATTGIDAFRDVVVKRDGTIVVAGLDRGQPSITGIVQSRGVALAYRDAFTEIANMNTAGTDSFESIAPDPVPRPGWNPGPPQRRPPGLPRTGRLRLPGRPRRLSGVRGGPACAP